MPAAAASRLASPSGLSVPSGPKVPSISRAALLARRPRRRTLRARPPSGGPPRRSAWPSGRRIAAANFAGPSTSLHHRSSVPISVSRACRLDGHRLRLALLPRPQHGADRRQRRHLLAVQRHQVARPRRSAACWRNRAGTRPARRPAGRNAAGSGRCRGPARSPAGTRQTAPPIAPAGPTPRLTCFGRRASAEVRPSIPRRCNSCGPGRRQSARPGPGGPCRNRRRRGRRPGPADRCPAPPAASWPAGAGKPILQHVQQPLPQGGGKKQPAVEAAPRRAGPDRGRGGLSGRVVRRRVAMGGKKGGQVARHRRVGSKGQAELLKAGTPPAGLASNATRGKKPSTSRSWTSWRRDFDLLPAADQPRARPGQMDASTARGRRRRGAFP